MDRFHGSHYNYMWCSEQVGGSGIFNLSQKFPWAAARQPLNMCLQLFILFPIQFIQGFPPRTLRRSSSNTAVYGPCLPSFRPVFPPPGIFQPSLLSETDRDLLFPSWETFTISLLISDWNLSSVGGHSRSLPQRTPVECTDFKIQLKCQLTSSDKSSCIPTQQPPPLLIVGATLLYRRQIHICWLVFVPSSFYKLPSHVLCLSESLCPFSSSRCLSTMPLFARWQSILLGP